MADPMAATGTWTTTGRVLLAGRAHGTALVLDEPLSFWGGLDPRTGTIVEERHPQSGSSLAGLVLVMPSGRGSSSSSSVLAEALRADRGPAPILLREPDEIVLVGALVVQFLYDRVMPTIQMDGSDYAKLRTGAEVSVDEGGRITVTQDLTIRESA